MSIRSAKVFLRNVSFSLHMAGQRGIVYLTLEVMKVENLSVTLKRRRKEMGFTLAQIADEMGVTEATVQRWESGNIKSIRYDKIKKLAEVLKVHPASFMGWGENKNGIPENLTPLDPMEKIPLIGEIACGTPILAEQNITDYVDLPGHIHADFALTCKGDSMIYAGIRDGDIVYIRHQEEVENGQIAAVMVGDEEATLKRFYFDGETLQLVPENSRYRPLAFTGEDINHVHVIGLAVAYTRVID